MQNWNFSIIFLKINMKQKQAQFADNMNIWNIAFSLSIPKLMSYFLSADKRRLLKE